MIYNSWVLSLAGCAWLPFSFVCFITLMLPLRVGSHLCGCCVPHLRVHNSPFIYMGRCTCGKCPRPFFSKHATQKRLVLWHHEVSRAWKHTVLWCLGLPLRINAIPAHKEQYILPVGREPRAFPDPHICEPSLKIYCLLLLLLLLFICSGKKNKF